MELVNDISLDAAKIGNFPHINQLRARKLSSEEEKNGSDRLKRKTG
jgi:hypothetical protein